jgi:DegV family protein with EDD domain
VLAAAEAVQSGEAVEGVLRAIQDTLERVRVFAIFDTLEFLARGGRVNLIQLGLSTLLKIKPMIELTKGRILSLGRMRTWSKAANALAERIVSHAPVEKLAVLHTNCLDCANDLRACIRDVLPAISAHSLTVEATTVIGTHVGPHALGVAAVTARRE